MKRMSKKICMALDGWVPWSFPAEEDNGPSTIGRARRAVHAASLLLKALMKNLRIFDIVGKNANY